MESGANDRKALIMFVSAMLIFGTIGVLRRYIPLSSAFIAFSRGLLGSTFILGFMKLKRKSIKEKLPVRTVIWLALTGVIIGVNWILIFEAYNHTTIAIATLCYYMQPTIVMLLSPLFFNERLTEKKGICATIAIIGMVLVTGVLDGRGSQAVSVQGILFGLGAAVFYAAVVIMNKQIRGIDAYQKTTVQLVSAGLVMVPYLILTNGFGGEGFNTRTVILLFILGIVHTGIAYVLYFGSMDGLKAQTVALFSYINLVAALLFSAVFLREPLSLPGIIGAVMIIGSAVLSEVQTVRQ